MTVWSQRNPVNAASSVSALAGMQFENSESVSRRTTVSAVACAGALSYPGPNSSSRGGFDRAEPSAPPGSSCFADTAPVDTARCRRPNCSTAWELISPSTSGRVSNTPTLKPRPSQATSTCQVIARAVAGCT